MSQYSVVAADGQLYGPADETMLAQWVREGRINAQTALHCHDTNQRVWAQSVPSLAPLIGLPPGVVQQLAQPAQYAQPQQHAYPPQPYPQQPQQAGYAQSPQMMGYAQPGGYANPVAVAGHQLTEFSPGVVVLLHFVTFGLFPIIHFGLMHDKLPKNRPDDPSAGKAIGFLFIPIFSIYWVFFQNMRLVDRVNEQRMIAGLPPGNQKNIFLWGMICFFATIPLIFIFLGFFTLLAAGVLYIVYYASLQGSVNELVQRTRGYGR